VVFWNLSQQSMHAFTNGTTPSVPLAVLNWLTSSLNLQGPVWRVRKKRWCSVCLTDPRSELRQSRRTCSSSCTQCQFAFGAYSELVRDSGAGWVFYGRARKTPSFSESEGSVRDDWKYLHEHEHVTTSSIIEERRKVG